MLSLLFVLSHAACPRPLIWCLSGTPAAPAGLVSACRIGWRLNLKACPGLLESMSLLLPTLATVADPKSLTSGLQEMSCVLEEAPVALPPLLPADGVVPTGIEGAGSVPVLTAACCRACAMAAS